MAASSERSPPPFPDSEEPELLEDSDEGADAFTGTVSNTIKRIYEANQLHTDRQKEKKSDHFHFSDTLTSACSSSLLQPKILRSAGLYGVLCDPICLLI